MDVALQDLMQLPQLRAVMDALPTHVWVALPDGTTEFQNKAWLDYVGFDAEQARGLGWKDAIHPDDVEQYVAKWIAIKDSKAPGEAEARFRRFDGEYRWFLMRVAPMLDTHGDVIKWYGTNTDIEDRKRSEQACRASERRLFEGIPALVALMSPLGEVELVNSQVLEYFNKTLEELKGWRTGDWLHPEDLPRVVAAWTRSVQSGERYDVEHRMRRADGVYRWFHVCGLPLRDAEGRTVNWLVLQTDVDDRRMAEQALRLSEERYARAMEGSDAGHWEWNMQTDDMFISERAREILGLPAGPLPARRAEVVAMVQEHPDDMLTSEQVRLSTLSGRHEREFRVISRPHDVRWLRTRGKVYKDADGTAIRMTGSLADITEGKRAQEALRASQERFALAIAASNDGIWDWNLLNDEQFFSERAQRIFGLEPERTVRQRAEWHTLREFHPDDETRRRDALERHLAGETPAYEGEWRVRPVGGKYRWVHTRGVCVRDAAGAPTRMVGSITDIDARKRGEDALRDSEGRYALAMQASGEGHWDWKIATDEFYASPRWREISGFAPDEELGGRAEMLARYPFHPEDRPKYEAAVADHFASKTRRLEMELRITPRGELRWAKFTAMCLRDGAGTPVRWAGSIMDITEQKRAAEALRESENRYERAMEGSDAGHWDWNLVTDEMFVSERAREMLALPKGALPRCRADIMALVPQHPDDRTEMVQRVRSSIESGRHEREYRVIPAAGEVRWLRSRGKVYKDAGGAAIRMTGSLTDVTERKLAAEVVAERTAHLKASEERYARAMEATEAGHWEWDLVANQVFHSARFRELYGIGIEEEFASRDEWKVRHPVSGAQRERQKRALYEAIADPTKRYDMEVSFELSPGHVRWLRSRGKVFRDENGRPLRVVGTTIDITARKRAEEALRSRTEMLELAQKSARAVAFDWRAELEEGWPPELEAMYGVAPGTWPGSFRPFGLQRQDWKKVVHPDDWAAVTEAIEHAHRTGEVVAEYRVIHADGSVHWLQSKGEMFFDADRNPVRMVGLIQDVTPLRHAEEELNAMERKLRQAQRLEAMGTLAGGIAHDFNNILGAILGYGEMALRDAAKGTRLRRDLESIVTAGERGRALIDRILAFSRSSVGERMAVHVEKVVGEALDLISGKLPPNVAVNAELHAGSAAILGDATQVHQVLMNLATNAIQAMSSGGTLRISLRTARMERGRMPTIGTIAASDYLVLEVADTGAGIPPEIAERIFDPFFTTKQTGTGTGLGLALVHGIVTGLDGAIDVASTPGAGTTFTVYLPRSGDAMESVAEREAEVPRGEGQRVLVVDDEEPLVRLAARTLEELGYVPTGFTSSAAALAAFRGDPHGFDAVITDERMPGLSGSALIRQMRGLRPSMPIMLMSGYIGGNVSSQAWEAGADEVLKKPLTARTLATTLARVLR